MSTLPGKFDVISSSRIPTMHFQNSLPKLPVPTLEDSLQRMLYAAEPLATAAELEEMRTLADEFASGHGKPLQEALVAKDKAIYSSFITEPWFDMYLKDRRPLLLNQNPQLTFKDEEGTRGGPGTQLARAARLVHGAATFQRTLETNQLIPDIFHTQPHRTKTRLWEETVRLLPSGIAFYGAAALGAYPLDMSQYANLFKSTRVPGVEKDELVVAPKAKHVCVMRNGHFYKVDVLDQDGATLPLPEIHGALQAVVENADAAPAPADEAIGLLTTLPRDQWARLRASIEGGSAENATSLAVIDDALFVLSLEPGQPKSALESCSFFLHGSGVDRWFDKSFSLIVSSDGQAAINFEHAWGDGVAVLRFFNEVYELSTSMPLTSPVPPSIEPTKASFALPADVKKAVADAKATFDTTVGRTELALLQADFFNSKMLKTAKLSPDGAMQMAFQLAHVKMHGGTLLPSTYESASTAAFKHGRTETIRSATPEALAFTKAFTDPSTSASTRTAALRQAVDNHSEITKAALMGKGWDRHLFALSHYAAAEGLDIPLFSCKAMQKLRHIILSTSTLNSEALAGGGFGPVNDDCYAIGYGIRSYGSEARVMTYSKDSQGFVDSLESAMKEMADAAIASATA